MGQERISLSRKELKRYKVIVNGFKVSSQEVKQPKCWISVIARFVASKSVYWRRGFCE
jgi:hypothetical protein